jgi:hypothetical protein
MRYTMTICMHIKIGILNHWVKYVSIKSKLLGTRTDIYFMIIIEIN